MHLMCMWCTIYISLQIVHLIVERCYGMILVYMNCSLLYTRYVLLIVYNEHFNVHVDGRCTVMFVNFYSPTSLLIFTTNKSFERKF